jgi:hypothetical protein
MRNHLISMPVANRKTIGETEPLLRGFHDVLNDDTFASTAIFSGMGLLAGLVAVICGVPGVWM